VGYGKLREKRKESKRKERRRSEIRKWKRREQTTVDVS
jgi:hypothetical protein